MKAEHSRRDFLTKSALAGMATFAVPLVACAGNENTTCTSYLSRIETNSPKR
jgi:uncharacterized protein (DUF1501 family)